MYSSYSLCRLRCILATEYVCYGVGDSVCVCRLQCRPVRMVCRTAVLERGGTVRAAGGGRGVAPERALAEADAPQLVAHRARAPLQPSQPTATSKTIRFNQ